MSTTSMSTKPADAGTLPVVVIGGGPAGMMAAVEAARRGLRVLLLEHNEKLGKKLYITGKGRCNLTNATPRETHIAHARRNGKFLYGALTRLDAQGLMDYVERLSVPLVVERGERVFPASYKASDVTRAFERELARLGVTVLLRTGAKDIVTEEGVARAVLTTDGRRIDCRSVVVATGGLSYPSTGSTGDGYRLAAALGHRVQPTSPTLVSVTTAESWPGELAGLSLRNVRLTVLRGKKNVWSEIGEMLFTHTGVSGPLVLTASSYLEADRLADDRLVLDAKPGLDAEQLDARLVRDFQANPNRSVKNQLPELLPARMAPIVADLAGIPADQSCHQVSRPQRERLTAMMKNLVLTPSALGSWNEAVVTRGGVACTEVDPKTMQSKLVQGLFFCGEVLDVDAQTGGFNLQIAFSTGYTAGQCC